jgi:hypothetical protein
MVRALGAAAQRAIDSIPSPDIRNVAAAEYFWHAQRAVEAAREIAELENKARPGAGAVGIAYGDVHVAAAGELRLRYSSPPGSEEPYDADDERMAKWSIELGSAALLDALGFELPPAPGQPTGPTQ